MTGEELLKNNKSGGPKGQGPIWTAVARMMMIVCHNHKLPNYSDNYYFLRLFNKSIKREKYIQN